MEISTNSKQSAKLGQRSVLTGIVINIFLGIIKGVAGVLGNSYALIADAIESCTDVFSSLAVFFGLRMAGKPADSNHPYGHGKFEPLAAAFVALVLMAAAILIAIASVREILTPHHAPAPFTLIVLVLTVAVKEILFRRMKIIGEDVGSSALQAEAWHHRCDAITSLTAFIGISIAVIGGPGYESADDFAALIAAVIIAINSVKLVKPAIFELTDAAPPANIAAQVISIAKTVPGVLGTHNCQVRKGGFDYFIDLEILCDPNLSIRDGHNIAHQVVEALHMAMPAVSKVIVHVEPVDDYGRRGCPESSEQVQNSEETAP